MKTTECDRCTSTAAAPVTIYYRNELVYDMILCDKCISKFSVIIIRFGLKSRTIRKSQYKIFPITSMGEGKLIE